VIARLVSITSCRSNRSHDDSPPILSREGNVDEISDESDTSESQTDVAIRPTLGPQQCQPETTFMLHINGPKENTAMDHTEETVRYLYSCNISWKTQK